MNKEDRINVLRGTNYLIQMGAAAYDAENWYKARVMRHAEELARRHLKAREFALVYIPHTAFRFEVETMRHGDDRVLMGAYAEVDVPNEYVQLGDRYAVQGYPIGTVVGVDNGMPGDDRTVTVRLDAVLPDLESRPVVLEGGAVYCPRAGRVVVTDLKGQKLTFDVDAGTALPIYATDAEYEAVAPECEARFDNAPPAKAVCPECGGTGFYVSPITAKRSPCSMGCKP